MRFIALPQGLEASFNLKPKHRRVMRQEETSGKDVAEEVSDSKVYDAAEAFGKKAGEMLTYADRLQASLRQDPLNYYAQQKYKEALAAGKSEGEAVRYALEEVAKLRSNPEALEKWLNEFANEQGIRSPKVNEAKLERVPEEVPNPEGIQGKGKQLQGEVSQQIGNTQKEISQKQNELKNYRPQKAKLFNLQAPTLELKFDPNNPKFKAYEREGQEWFEGQTAPPIRLFNNVKDKAIEFGGWAGGKIGGFVIDLGKNAINTYNAVNQAAREIDSRYGNIRYKP
jgi:hypothetical protein